MNLLVTGNGFDLAHRLPTHYSDFLDFMVLCINKLCPNWRNIGWQCENDELYKLDKYEIDEEDVFIIFLAEYGNWKF